MMMMVMMMMIMMDSHGSVRVELTLHSEQDLLHSANLWIIEWMNEWMDE